MRGSHNASCEQAYFLFTFVSNWKAPRNNDIHNSLNLDLALMRMGRQIAVGML